jgi:hypothetical protein
MPETTPVAFTLEELWLLQGCIRHEVPQQESWRMPPASLALNDAIAEGILFCTDGKEDEAAVLLSMADCLAIDATVPSGARNVDGLPIGRSVLLKSFRARQFLALGELPTSDVTQSQEEIHARISTWRNECEPGNAGDAA